MTGLSLFNMARENQKQYTAWMMQEHPIHDMTQICYIFKNIHLKHIMMYSME